MEMSSDEIQLYCSAGRGSERFVEKELKTLFNISEVKRKCDGKIFFSLNSTEDFTKLLQLKTAERIFVELNCFKTRRLPYGKGAGQFINALKRRLVKIDKYLRAAGLFRTFQSENDLCSEPKRKKQKLNYGVESGNNVGESFRVSCKISGDISKFVAFQELNVALGKHIMKVTGWPVDLKNPDFEVNIHINDEKVVAGIPLTCSPVSQRDYILHSGLRSTIACIMADLANIQTSDIVLDAMCGKATILVEAAKSLQRQVVYIGIDNDSKQLQLAADNIQYAGLDNIHLIHSNSLDLPLRDISIDKIVCDAPFGQKYDTQCDIHHFYNQLLLQFYRVLRPGGRMILLTSSDLRQHVIQCLQSSKLDPESSKSSESLKLGPESTKLDTNPNHSETEPIQPTSKQCHISSLNKSLQINSHHSINIVKDNKNMTCNIAAMENHANNATCKIAAMKQNNQIIISKNIAEDDLILTPDLSVVSKKCESEHSEDLSTKYGQNNQTIETNRQVSSNIINSVSDHSDKNQRSLQYITDYYVKLGQTHAYIIVAEKV